MTVSMDTGDDVEWAAGGLVWFENGVARRMAVVHRPKHRDWTLPKGKPDPGEGMKATARREAMEETGWQVAVEDFAGTFSYLKGGRPKVVVMWHMRRLPERYAQRASSGEIDRIEWMLPREALDLLTHEVEKDFLRRHGLNGTEGKPEA